jgi:hypothetical protein
MILGFTCFYSIAAGGYGVVVCGTVAKLKSPLSFKKNYRLFDIDKINRILKR